MSSFVFVFNQSLENNYNFNKKQNPVKRQKAMRQDQDFEFVKPFICQNYQEYRILQPNAVFIHGLPEKYSKIDKLKFHLSNYGQILKITSQFVSKNFYYCHVQYESQISACLAVTVDYLQFYQALDDYYFERRFLKVSFASTKFCPYFLKGSNCNLEACNYAHYYNAELTHLKVLIKLRKDFAKQINHHALAFNKIWQNYQEAFILLFKNQQKSLIFPSCSVKLNQIFQMKSSEFEEWEKKLQESIDVLEKQLQKIKKNKSLKSLKNNQISKDENQIFFQDDWLNLDDSISDFLEQEAEQSIKTLKKSKTEIQKFLEESEQNLMSMIFKSGLQEAALELKNS